MKSFFYKIQNNKKIILGIVLVCFIFIFLNITPVSAASLEGAIAKVLGWIAALITTVIGYILAFLIKVLINVAQFNNIINVPVVTKGWVIVRDLCNMFFVLILLVIAFATILRIESYPWKKLLPKLLIMAVLINFSKTIFGLIIDFAQVIMLTFVNALGTYAPNNLIEMFKIKDMGAMKTGMTEKLDDKSWATSVAIITGVFAMLITLIVVVVMLAVLIMRVIMLWIYTILSPLVFLGFALPALQKYTSRIWEDFIKQVIVGPMLAFFLWLALTTAGDSASQLSTLGGITEPGKEICAGINKLFCESNFQTFIIVIGLLMGGLMITQQMGGAAGAAAGRGMGAIQKGRGLTWRGVKGVGKGVGYVPKQYAKRAGYAAGDLALEGLKRSRMPVIKGLAMKKQAELKMVREFKEEKDTRYMKYLSEPDLDRVMRSHRGAEGKGILARVSRGAAFVGRGMESSRQDFKRALIEKMNRGEDWGHGDERNRRKTQAMIELAGLAGHSVTEEGEDSFRDAELGKLFHEFRNKHVGNINDDLMSEYYGTVRGGRYPEEQQQVDAQGNPVFVDAQGRDAFVDAQGNRTHRSEYSRESDVYETQLDANRNPLLDSQGNPARELVATAGPGMLAYTARRMKERPFRDLHHSQLTDNVLNAITLDEAGNRIESRKLARKHDLESVEDTRAIRRWAERTKTAPVPGVGLRPYYLGADRRDPYPAGHPLSTTKAARGDLGASRMIVGEAKSPEVASGITNVDKIQRGVERGKLSLNFSDFELDPAASGKYFDGDDKAEIAGRIRNSLQESGIAENIAKSVEDQVNKASYLILRNREAGVSLAESKTAQAHELIHARTGSAFSDEELKGVWESMSEGSREQARQKVGKMYDNKEMSEEATMHEYFTEGLTSKTKWAEKDTEKRITLDPKAEAELNKLLESKGSNIGAFTSGLTKTRPTREDTKQAIANAVDPGLRKSMGDLASAMESLGSGLDAINQVGGGLANLEKSVHRNSILLEKSAKAYKDSSSNLSNLASRIS